MKEIKNISQHKKNLTKINFWNDNFLYKNTNLNQNKENIYQNNDKLKRFRKRVIHISKRNNIIINPIKDKNEKKLNIFTNFGSLSNNINSISNNLINKTNTNNQKNVLKENKSIQNIFYNTYYNCQFDKKYHIGNSNDFINNDNNKNDLIKNKYSFLKKSEKYKSTSSEKNIFNRKKLFDI